MKIDDEIKDQVERAMAEVHRMLQSPRVFPQGIKTKKELRMYLVGALSALHGVSDGVHAVRKKDLNDLTNRVIGSIIERYPLHI